MKTDIEKPLIEAYHEEGVFILCVAALQYKYDIQYPRLANPPSEEVKRHLGEMFRARIRKVDVTPIVNMSFHKLCDLEIEITNNLRECPIMEDKESYLYGLMYYFTSLSRLQFPELTIDPEVTTEPFRSWFITRKERFDKIRANFDYNDEVEELYSTLARQASHFANMLDSICLRSKIDLLSLQRKYDIYLKGERYIRSLVPYIGSEELVQKLIDALPKQGQLLPSSEAIPQQDTSTVPKEKKPLPSEVSYFTWSKRFKPSKRKDLYDKLKNNGFIYISVPESHFYWAFGGTPIPEGEPSFEPIKWEESIDQLVYMLFHLKPIQGEKEPLWKKANHCFRCKDKKTGEYAQPNTNSMKSAKSDVKKHANREKYSILRDIVNQI
jgi:hypothetical protein